MSSGALVSFDELVAAGTSAGNGDATTLTDSQRDDLKQHRLAIRDQLKHDRKDDPDAQPPKKPNWVQITEAAEKALRAPYKDLQVAAHLTEALTVLHGFRGLHDGLHLMRRIVDECWDRLNPPVEDGDVEPYAAPFNWLDDADTGALFPNRIRSTALIRGKDKNLDYSYLDWRQSQDARGRISWAEFQKVVDATPLSDCEEIAAEVARCVDESQKLSQSLSARFASAPQDLRDRVSGLTSLVQALRECDTLIQEIVRKKRPVDVAAGGAVGSSADAGADFRSVGSRDAIYLQLRQAADALQRLEPHSPVPYLVNRAVELGPLPFHQMIRALIRDATVLQELSRELGIKEEPAPEQSEE